MTEDQMKARIAELEAALKPFADHADRFAGDHQRVFLPGALDYGDLMSGHFKKAKALLVPAPKPEPKPEPTGREALCRCNSGYPTWMCAVDHCGVCDSYNCICPR